MFGRFGREFHGLLLSLKTSYNKLDIERLGPFAFGEAAQGQGSTPL